MAVSQIIICWIMLSSVCVVQSSNFDARFSVIKSGPYESYFGFSVAQHQFTNENGEMQRLFLVGAPYEKRIVGTRRTPAGGSVYNCSPKTTDEDDCVLVKSVDPQIGYRSTESVNDQWLGVTVASAGVDKKAVACTHRYVKDNAAVGACNLLESDLSFTTVRYQSCRKLPHKKYMEDFGLCQQGLSAVFGQDDALLMGAPGSVFWQGTVFYVNVTDIPGFSSAEKSSPYFRPDNVKGGQQLSATEPYSYNGYSLAMGKFDSSKKLYFVSGAPKSKETGQVIFYTDNSQSNLRYEEKHILKGKMDFSGFGTSLLAVDLNNDGFDDLIVGAPYYYSRYHGGAIYVYLGGPQMISATSPATELLSRDMPEKECKELMCEHALFGISLTKLGDINKDGFQDFAVGAPFEGNGAVYIYHGSDAPEGFNTKYAQRIVAQDLPTTDNIMSFGYSLSGGMDLDDNGYPDLLIGAYEENKVALIRTRPIIELIPRVTVSLEAVDLENHKCDLDAVPLALRDRPCFELTLCLEYTSSIQVNPEVTYTLLAEPQRRLSRVELLNAKDDNKVTLTGSMPLDATRETCVTKIAIVKYSNKFEDKLNPMTFKFKFGLTTDTVNPQAYPSSAVQDINEFPFLNTDDATSEESNSKIAQVEFVKECGDDNKCYSNLQFTAGLANLTKDREDIYQLIISNENILSVEISVTNINEPAYLTKVYIQAPKSLVYLGTEPKGGVTCRRSTENRTWIECDDIGNPLRSDKDVSFVVSLNVPKDYADDPDLVHNITVKVNTSSTELTPINDIHVLKFSVINKAEVTLTTNVAPDNTIECKGEPRGASAMADERSIGASVTHNFIINNRGPGVVSKSYISIKWPYEVADGSGAGKHLLYMMSMPKISGPVEDCNDDEIRQYINPLGIQKVASPAAVTGAARDPDYVVVNGESISLTPPADVNNAPSRQRREIAESLRSGSSARYLTMSCQDGTAKCFEYKCMIGTLESQKFVKISMEARLWESTLLSDFRETSGVEIISWAQYFIPDRLKITQDKSDDSRRAITRAIPDILETSGGKIKWWIILVAVLVGLVLLLVLIFILYKVGFFRRKRMEDMQMYKAEKKQQAMLQEYDNDGA